MSDNITIKPYLVQESYYEDGWDGSIDVLHYLVKGMDPSAVGTLMRAADAIERDASGNIVRQIPLIGDAHPDTDGHLQWYCRSKQARPFGTDSKTAVLVRCEFQDCGGIIIRKNGQVVRDTTRFDVNGNRLLIEYAPDGASAPDCDAEAPIARPRDIIEFERYELGASFSRFHDDVRLAYNLDESFQGRGQYQWLNLEISGGPVDFHQRGLTDDNQKRSICRFKYVFESAPRSNTSINNDHRPLLWYVPRNQTKPPPQIDPKADGIKQAMLTTPYPDPVIPDPEGVRGYLLPHIQRAADFSVLKLPNHFWPFDVPRK